jgi:hypothetical protein
MARYHGIHKGKWAGPRLDIVPLDTLNRENEDGSWKDIGDEVAKEIAEIWKTDLGEDWREQVIRYRA